MSSARVAPPPSTVDFPLPREAGASSSAMPPTPHARAQYLPFRRISLPTAPGSAQRNSMASVSSFDSVPEAASDPSTSTPVIVKNAIRKSRPVRPASLEPERRRSHWKLRPIDEAREAKRRKVVGEFLETERSYVDGLNLIYEHFLTPIIASLDSPQPLLERTELTSVFSNFIDIWNLHRSFYSSLSALLSPPPSSSPTSDTSPPQLSPVLLSHFPYLSLYNPFVTAFPDALSSLNSLLSSRPAFAAFVNKQQADERCGRLKLRDWLLTIVQRCPRYLLLLKDLIGATDPADPEHASLTAVHTLVSKITNTLNTSLHTHAQTLALLALQRSTSNLPFQLITPGRSFIRRGPLLQLEGASDPRDREFLLFSDCLIWLASADGRDGELAEKWEWGNRRGVGGYLAVRPAMIRKRSKSDAELPTMRTTTLGSGNTSLPPSPVVPSSPSTSGFGPHSRPVAPRAAAKRKKRMPSSGQEEKWMFKGRVELIDVEVVVSPPHEPDDERRLELMSPERSFAVYAGSEAERDEWASAIRSAKAALLISLNAMHPHSTLTSSGATAHLRRTLQALPHLPEDEAAGRKPKRGKVEHFVPAIWIPDAKTESCMRCGRAFGWRRRRHHCRLCGRCVCSSCSGQVFYISDPDIKVGNKPARACDACYETVFPIIAEDGTLPSPPPSATVEQSNTASTLSNFPSWQSISMPSLALPGAVSRNASALLGSAFDHPSRRASQIEGSLPGDSAEVSPRIRIRAPSRPRSYVQILEDFQAHDSESALGGSSSTIGLATSAPPFGRSFSERSALTLASTTEGPSSDEALVTFLDDLLPPAEPEGIPRSPTLPPHKPPETEEEDAVARLPGTPVTKRPEDTVRKHKRFSMPAFALQTTPVTAKPNTTGEGKSKRFSLVLGRHAVGRHGGTVRASASASTVGSGSAKGLSGGAAAVKLSELLGRKKS